MRPRSATLVVVGLAAIVATAVGPLAAPAARAQEGLKYLAFGDSITEGVGDTGGNQNGYPGRLQGLLRAAGQNEARVVNHGVGGETTAQGLSRIGSVLSSGGDFILIMEGTNDINARISTNTIFFNLQQMVDRSKAAGVTPIWATIIPLRPSAGTTADRDLAIAMRQRSLNENRDLVDNYAEYSYTPSAWPDLYNTNLSGDPVGHPNARGYDVIAQTFADVILDNDTQAPVLGAVDPLDGSENVAAGKTVEVVVFDLGAGVDATGTRMLVNGVAVDAQHSGTSRKRTYRYTPPSPWSGVVEIDMDLRDTASPPNTQTTKATRFTVKGAAFFRGDIDKNGRVDGHDLVLLAFSFGSSRGNSRYREAHDLDNDGFVGGSDLAILATNFGRGA